MLMRLHKYMAESGVGSRRACEKLIAEGKVFVDGAAVSEMGVKVDTENSVVVYEGKVLKPVESKVYIALHKPVGYITTVDDQFARPTVIDLLKGVNKRVFPAGRLDYDTSGLIFLTNDGDFAYTLTHPKHNIYKRYLVLAKGNVSKSAIDQLRQGVLLEGRSTLPSTVTVTGRSGGNATVSIAIMEGRNRQIRRMFEAVGHPVISLHRTAIGDVEIGGLKSGEYRYLNNEEIRSLI